MKQTEIGNMIKKGATFLFDIVGWASVILLVAGICWYGGQIFLFSSYRIPTHSMVPTLQPGDCILVCKPYMGARLFSLEAAFDHRPLRIHRTRGWSHLKTGDVAVFNFPYPQTRDSIGFDVMLYYVKRCIGTPGDSLSIVEGYYHVNGQRCTNLPTAVMTRQDSLHQVFYHGEAKIEGVSTNAFPKKREIGWSILDFGPLYLPKHGDILTMNRRHFLLYRRLIEWEQEKKLTWKEGAAYLDNQRIDRYHFRKNYYFMGGDNVFDSVDSRYWGLVPEEYIAGRAMLIWKSTDHFTGKIHWDRVFKVIE